MTTPARRVLDRAMTEREFQEQVIALARSLGYRVYHSRTARVQRKDGSTFYATPLQGDPGFPDLVLVGGHPARVLFVELKRERGKLTADQLDWGVLLRVAGANWRCWWPSDWDEIRETLAGAKGDADEHTGT